MALNISTYTLNSDSSVLVKAVQVTEENIAELAEWTRGKVGMGGVYVRHPLTGVVFAEVYNHYVGKSQDGENFVLRRESFSPLYDKRRALTDEFRERERQTERWGEQNHTDGTGPDMMWLRSFNPKARATEISDFAKVITDDNAQAGFLTWRDILLEEVAEAFAENDPEKLRTELIQVAAVATQWADAIDRRASNPSWGS